MKKRRPRLRRAPDQRSEATKMITCLYYDSHLLARSMTRAKQEKVLNGMGLDYAFFTIKDSNGKTVNAVWVAPQKTFGSSKAKSNAPSYFPGNQGSNDRATLLVLSYKGETQRMEHNQTITMKMIKKHRPSDL